MGRKKDDRKEKEEGRFVQVGELGEHEKLARHLGYKEKCSVNNVARGHAHELGTIRHSFMAAGAVGVASLGFVIGALASDERRTRLLEVAAFLAIWVIVALAYAKRAKTRASEYEQLEKIVREKLGK